MHRYSRLTRLLLFALLLAAAFASASCDSASGVGVGMDYPARWGGGTSGPPIFVGGPSF